MSGYEVLRDHDDRICTCGHKCLSHGYGTNATPVSICDPNQPGRVTRTGLGECGFCRCTAFEAAA